LESTSKSIEEIEVDKYLNKDKRFQKNILANSKKPSL
jgi:two-component system phosphate regulon sensor histidine kinase PhoR